MRSCGTAALFSDVLNFTTNPPIGPNVPVVLGLIGDLGQTYDSATTVQHVLADSSIQVRTFFFSSLTSGIETDSALTFGW